MSTQVTQLPFVNKISARHPIRGDVADISSGRYYQAPCEWYDALVKIADKYGWGVGERPDFTIAMETSDQRYIPLYRGDEQVGAVYVVSYRMPSFNYEMVCYVI